VQKVTLIPRGQARGLTWFIPGEDPTLISKSQIFARIVGALGGRAAEEIIFGHAEVTSGECAGAGARRSCFGPCWLPWRAAQCRAVMGPRAGC
jgi:hypothetical protein